MLCVVTMEMKHDIYTSLKREWGRHNWGKHGVKHEGKHGGDMESDLRRKRRKGGVVGGNGEDNILTYC